MLNSETHNFNISEALKEASRCLNCTDAPCIDACPLNNDIPLFIRHVSEGNFGEAYGTLAKNSSLPAVCSRVCPHERLCEASCRLAENKNSVLIGNLERFIADFAHDNKLQPLPPTTGERGKTAIIGSGPAGLAVAGELAKMNFSVTIFEAQKKAGGVLLFGIPGFRLDKDVLKKEISQLEKLGVKIKTETRIGENLSLQDLSVQGYDAIFLGTGTSLPKTLNIPGKDLSGVIAATYYLQTVFLADQGKVDVSETIAGSNSNVVIIGAGNVAMDAALTALNRGARKVTVIYHKTREEMSADPELFISAAEKGVHFMFLKQPIAYLNKKQMRALKGSYGKPGPEDDRKLAGILLQEIVKNPDGSFQSGIGQEFIPCDDIILAIGQRPSVKFIKEEDNIKLDNDGHIIIREKPYGMTTHPGIFSSGDLVAGTDTVVYTIEEAKKAALGIAQYVDAKRILADIL